MMILHQTTRSYCSNKEYSLYSLVFKLQEVNSVFKTYDENYLSEVGLLSIQNSLLFGSYSFSPLRLVILYRDDPHGTNSTPSSFSIEPTVLEDKVVIGALGALLIEIFAASSYFCKSCFSTYNNKGLDSVAPYHSRIQEWRGVEELLRLDCSCSCMTVPTSRLIEKVKTIMNNPQLIDLINRFCNLPIRDERGCLFSHNTCFPHMTFIGDILKNILLEEMDHVMKKQFPKLEYVRFQHGNHYSPLCEGLCRIV